MNGREAKEIARQWVIENPAREPGFYGAFFVGSINWLADETPLPETSDIDIQLVLEGPKPPFRLNTFRHRGLLLEVSYAGSEEFQSADAISGNYILACHFARPCIISDPTGQLTQIQQTATSSISSGMLRMSSRSNCNEG